MMKCRFNVYLVSVNDRSAGKSEGSIPSAFIHQKGDSKPKSYL